MQAITLADLHILDTSPRIQDLKLAEALGFGRLRDIRQLIERNVADLEALGDVYSRQVSPDEAQEEGGLRRGAANLFIPNEPEEGVLPYGAAKQNIPSEAKEGGFPHGGENPPKRRNRGGRPATEYWLNEEQSYMVCILARTPRSRQVRILVIKVFAAWRKGEMYGAAERPAPEAPPAGQGAMSLAERREARLRCEAIYTIFGAASAQAEWVRCGLGYVHNRARPGAEMDAACGYEALRLILDAPIDGAPARDWIGAALDGDLLARERLNQHDIRVVTEIEPGLVFGHSIPFVRDALKAREMHGKLLQLLSGAREWCTTKFAGLASRCTFVPLGTLDDEMTGGEA